MPSDNLTELDADDSRGALAAGRVLAILTGILVFANCLINSPSRFSQRHEADQTWLKPIVTALGLGGRLGTARGVEVRNLIFYGGAALILAAAAIRMATTRRRARYSLDDLLDFRERAGSPYFWWALWLVCCGISSFFSHAPDICQGQTVIHLFWLAWWWPLAAMLNPRQVRGVAMTVTAALATTAALGLVYQAIRGGEQPWTARLNYPFGNELWLAACLLPGIPIGVSLIFSARTITSQVSTADAVNAKRRILAAWSQRGIWAALTALITVALLLTRSRSAIAGLAAVVIAFTCILVGRKLRRIIVLVVLLVGIGGAALLNRVVSESGVVMRAESIRSRVNFEWPYAIRLMLDKPVVGHGDGAYSMLAGQFAREDQLEDPAVLRFDEQSWTGHAHNEYLELAADTGIVGAGAYLLALIITLVYVCRHCDRRHVQPSDADNTASPVDRLFAAGLGAALVGMAVDQFAEPSIREPGGQAVFLTVWALAWAAVRRERLEKFEQTESERLSNVAVRLAGTSLMVGAIWLGYTAVQDWRAASARLTAQSALENGQFHASFESAVFAGEYTLDPFQRNLARLIAVRAMTMSVDVALSRVDPPIDQRDMNHATNTVLRLSELRSDAPRFLQLSRLEAELALSFARMAQRRGESTTSGEYQRRFLAAMEQLRADEPFSSQIVAGLWQLHPETSARNRIDWLRPLLRGGFADDPTIEMMTALSQSSDLPGVITDLTNIALSDVDRPQRDWRDRLSPETLRLASMLARRSGESVRALSLADRAVRMYERAGPGLFAARVAAIGEWVECDVTVGGAKNADINLQRLAVAISILWGRTVKPDEPLPGPLGKVRLQVLISAGRDAAAQTQRELLASLESGA